MATQVKEKIEEMLSFAEKCKDEMDRRSAHKEAMVELALHVIYHVHEVSPPKPLSSKECNQLLSYVADFYFDNKGEVTKIVTENTDIPYPLFRDWMAQLQYVVTRTEKGNERLATFIANQKPSPRTEWERREARD